MKTYGSTTNGLVSSITQFLTMISFLEMGVGAVVQSSFYKPIYNKDTILQSKIYRAAQHFFRTIAVILFVYSILLAVFFPLIAKARTNYFSVMILVIAMSIGSFFQYFFGITNALFLSSNQKGYIQYNLQVITLILNVVISYFLMINNFSIQIVMLSTSIFYLIRPLFLYIYVKINYSLDKHIVIDNDVLPNKWSGIAQHVAAIVQDSTDVIILTIFSTLESVSIYNIYSLVVMGLKKFFVSLFNGVQATMGELYAGDNKKKLNEVFFKTEWLTNFLSIIIWGITYSMLTPFILLYTKGINDADYNQPIFGYFFVISMIFYCIRLPYHTLIKSAGKYKETQWWYILSAIINLVLSIMFVYLNGIIGVVIGTLISMVFQFFGLAIYCYRYILKNKMVIIYKHICMDVLIFINSLYIVNFFDFGMSTTFQWMTSAIGIGLIWIIISVIYNCIFHIKKLRIILLQKDGFK